MSDQKRNCNAKDDGTAVRVLLQDQQVRFQPGGNSVFAEGVMALQTAQGLAAGNISFAWDPATQKPTVHRLLIRRGDKVVDVLASQKFTVLRREQNLESATLDGVLTATLQPEGLEVGDVVDFALSIDTHDPVLGTHVERLGAGWNGVAVARAHLRAEWPDTIPLRIRQTAGLPPLKEDRQNGVRSAELLVDGLPVLPPPNGAPARFSRLRWVEMSDWRSWADLGALMAPLYAKAATLPPTGPLHDEWARLDAGAATPEAKAAALLAFVEQRVRYVALQMGQGGYVPADAATTWERRFGDCKGKTALLLALLHASGIAAVPVAANAVSGDGTDESLPMVELFNHVLVRATIAGRDYWLDATRTGDTDLSRLRVPAFGWGVPLVARGAAPVLLQPSPLDRPDEDREIAIDATAGISLPAAFRVTSRLRGDGGQATGLTLSALPADQRDRALRDYWRKEYSFVEPQQVAFRYDPATGEATLTMGGTATLDWRDGWYETDGTGLGWQADFHRDPGPNAQAPFANAYPFFSRVKEVITLPPGFHGGINKERTDVDRVIAGVQYHRTADLRDATFTVEATQRSLQPEFPAADAPAAQAALRKLADQNVFLGRPADYKPTGKELDTASKTTLTTVPALLDRAYAFERAQRYKEAIADLTRAIAIDARSASAYANRAYALVESSGDAAAAEKDLLAAAAINPREPVMLRTRALAAANNNDLPAGVRYMTQSLEVDPGNVFALALRGQMKGLQGDMVGALPDLEAAAHRAPHDLGIQHKYLELLDQMGRHDEERTAIAAMLAANPDSGFADMLAAHFDEAMGDRAAAATRYDHALAIRPAPYIYLARATGRPAADKAGRRADLREALRLEPAAIDASIQLAKLAEEEGDDRTALGELAPALAAHPHDVGLLAWRGMVLDHAGRLAEARRSFASSLAEAADHPATLNEICWLKATRGVALLSALEDCNAAIAKDPSANYLDSRGLVNLRLGRLDAALADYDAALAKNPKLASSLMGRSLVHGRRGETAAAAADRLAALAVDPRIGKTYADYGLGGAPVALAVSATPRS